MAAKPENEAAEATDEGESSSVASAMPEPAGPDTRFGADPRSDSELADAVGEGDMLAFNELWGTRYQHLVKRYCVAKLGRQDSAAGSIDDTVQEISMAVFLSLRSQCFSSRHEATFKSWLYGIAAHKVADQFRSQYRNRNAPYSDMPELPSAAAGPEDMALAADLSQRVRQLLGQLSARQHEVLVLRIGVGLSAEEAAEMTESTPVSVRVAQWRALERLRKILRDNPQLYPGN